MENSDKKKSLKNILFKTLDMILDGEATPDMVEQVCYISEQMIKDDKNSIEIEKARMMMEFERQERIENSTIAIAKVVESISDKDIEE